MEVLRPRTLAEALAMKAANPDATPIAGGTDLMVEINFGRRRPERIMDSGRLEALRRWQHADGTVFLGAGMTYARMIRELPIFAALVQASRSVGSPQIRNRGTVGGNLGTASPAGDVLPVLAAYDAEIVLARDGGGERALPWHRFLVGPKQTALAPQELVVGTRWRPARGPGSLSKVGPRNAMVIAVASLCFQMDEEARAVRVALGAVGPTVLRASDAEAFLARALANAGACDDPRAPLGDRTVQEFGERAAAAARPIDDIRGTVVYRRHVCGVLAQRALSWALDDRRHAAGPRRVAS